MTARVFIDGAAGTTGLVIVERLALRSEFELIVLDDEQRKSADARRDAYHAADFAVLCLPDDAAREAVALAEGRVLAGGYCSPDSRPATPSTGAALCDGGGRRCDSGVCRRWSGALVVVGDDGARAGRGQLCPDGTGRIPEA